MKVNPMPRRLRSQSLTQPARDRGAVLPLVLVLVVIGSLIVLPVMSYATTVLKANSVLSAKTQRFEAVKAGMRTALFDPLDLYRECDQSQAAPVDYSSMTLNGVAVDTTCQLVGYAKTVIDDHLRYGLAATELGATIPAELNGKKYTSSDNESAWAALTTSALEDDPNESRPGTIWLPDLASYPLITRSRVQGWDMPSAYGGCKVYFPGKYVDDVVLTGKTFFTSGVYYFEGDVRVESGADVVVGDGRYEGCATSQEAVFFSSPTLGSTEPHGITGFGATWLFGGEGRLVVSDAGGQAVKLLFNRRYVDDRASDPSLFVSIASVNGDVLPDGTYVDYTEAGHVNVPVSRVLVGRAPDGSTTYDSPKAHQMVPSVLTDVARPPSAAPTLDPIAAYRTSELGVAGTNGEAYLSWHEPDAATWGGSQIQEYRVFVDDEVSPRCTVPATAAYLECRITGLSVGMTDTTHVFRVLVTNAVGPSPEATTQATYRNGPVATGGSPLHPEIPAPNAPTATKYNKAMSVAWTAPTLASPSTPITHYVLTGESRPTGGSPTTTMSTTCNVNLQDHERGATRCRITGLNKDRDYRFKVTAVSAAGVSSAESPWSAWVRADGSGTAPADNLALGDRVLPSMPDLHTAPIVDIDLTGASKSSVRIPGYIAVPQGTIRINNAPGAADPANAHNVEVVGGILAARFDVADGRVPAGGCDGCISLGFESEVVQMRLRLVSTTSSGVERSVAVVQVNENGAYAVNSWEVQ